MARLPNFYNFMLVDLENQTDLWTAPYKRTLASGVGWTDGDRVGYRCGYGFLLRNKIPVGRVTFQVIPGGEGYYMVNDRYMIEGSRYYDGHVATGGLAQLNDCPPTSESYTDTFDGDHLPVIKYETTGGVVLETRNYPTMVHASNVTFQVMPTKTDKRIPVVAYRNGSPAIVVYYESIAADVVMTSSI